MITEIGDRTCFFALFIYKEIVFLTNRAFTFSNTLCTIFRTRFTDILFIFFRREITFGTLLKALLVEFIFIFGAEFCTFVLWIKGIIVLTFETLSIILADLAMRRARTT